MKTRIKLAFGITLAVVAVMAATKPGPERRLGGKENPNACYSAEEVDLLMRSNKWTKEQATTILDLACQYSKK